MIKNIVILCGGQNVEHDVSLMSASNVIRDLDTERFTKTIVYITRSGQWLLVTQEDTFLKQAKELCVDTTLLSPLLLQPGNPTRPLVIQQSGQGIHVDCIFPVLHGSLAEDGTLQGLLEVLGVPYVGCDTMSSAVCMEKHIVKQLLQHSGIPTLPWITMHVSEKDNYTYTGIAEQVAPIFFMKTVKSGSSIGVYKIRNEAEYREAIDAIFNFDHYIIIEKAVVARELEVSVLGNTTPQATVPGEVIVFDDFYSYDAKYFNAAGSRTESPAKISDTLAKTLQQLAIVTFKALRCCGMARIDFLAVSDDEYYLNEINPLPGFTDISMYPKNWAASELTYSQLITTLIELAEETHAGRLRVLTGCQQFVTDKRAQYSES
ncbi:MAG: D-alanine--D-alanine ligase A [Coxiella sp. (in: Bacteria)]|nr:MAG: D-alanine--D-alanine ligase A [Coxiella sp. (in: g-proteobacteria)]